MPIGLFDHIAKDDPDPEALRRAQGDRVARESVERAWRLATKIGRDAAAKLTRENAPMVELLQIAPPEGWGDRPWGGWNLGPLLIDAEGKLMRSILTTEPMDTLDGRTMLPGSRVWVYASVDDAPPGDYDLFGYSMDGTGSGDDAVRYEGADSEYRYTLLGEVGDRIRVILRAAPSS